MNGKKVAQVGIIVVCLSAAAYFIYGQLMTPDSSSELEPGRTLYWICMDCNAEWSTTAREMEAQGGEVPCPKCSRKSSAGLAFHCDACGRNVPPFGHGTKPDNCPYCKAPLK